MKSFEFLSEATGSGNIYTVRSGDSLQSIAKTNDTTIDGIMWQNPQFASPGDIVLGSRIRLPGFSMPNTVPSPAPASSPGGAAGNAKIAMDYFVQQGSFGNCPNYWQLTISLDTRDLLSIEGQVIT